MEADALSTNDKDFISPAGGKGLEGPHSNPGRGDTSITTPSSRLDLSELGKVAAGFIANGIAE